MPVYLKRILQRICRCSTIIICLLLVAGQGGAASRPEPDGFNYLTGITTYDWVDISATGTSVALGDDDYTGALAVGFSFSFYGTAYTDFFINSNGTIGFGAGSDWYNETCPVPNNAGYHDYIALMGNDLDPDSGGDIFYQSFSIGSCPYNGYTGSCLVVQYQDIPLCCSSTQPASTFEAILLDNNTVVAQYNSSELEAVWGNDSIVAIEGNNVAADHGISYMCLSRGSLYAGLAVQFGVGIKVVGLQPNRLTASGCGNKSNMFDFGMSNYNNGSDKTFNLTYAVTGNKGSLTGPATVTVGENVTKNFTVNLVPQVQAGDSVTATISAISEGSTTTATIEMGVTAQRTEQITASHWPRRKFVSAAYVGKVWVIAGANDQGGVPLVESYNPETASWVEITGSSAPFGERAIHSGCQAEESVYMWGNKGTGLYSYNMENNTWTDLTAASGQPNPANWDLSLAAWVYDPDAKVCYATGGNSDATGNNAKTVFVYSPAENKWLKQLPDFTSGRDEHAAWMVGTGAGRKLCIAGGDVNCLSGTSEEDCNLLHKKTQCLPLEAATWNAENADLGSLSVGLAEMGFAKRMNCRGGEELWMIGGDLQDGPSRIQTTLYYDVLTEKWISGPLLSGGGYEEMSAVVLNDILYKLNGENKQGDDTTQCEKIFACKGCFPWPMFIPAATGTGQN